MKVITVLSDEDPITIGTTLNLVPPMEKGLSKQFFGNSVQNLSSSPERRALAQSGSISRSSTMNLDQKAKPSRKYIWLSDLDTFGFKFSGVIAVQKLQQILVPNYISRDDFLSSLDTKNSSVLKKISEAFKVEKKKTNQTEKTFGVPLEVVLGKYPSKIEIGVGPNPKTVPYIISESIKLMLKMGTFLFIQN